MECIGSTTVTGVCLNKFFKTESRQVVSELLQAQVTHLPYSDKPNFYHLLERLVCFASKHQQQLPAFTERGNVT